MDKVKGIWLKVTLDEYQLPLAVADSAAEMAKMCGTSKNSIVSNWNHYKHGRIKNTSYIYVKVDEDE